MVFKVFEKIWYCQAPGPLLGLGQGPGPGQGLGQGQGQGP